MLGILVSRPDEASVHIGEHLRDLEAWEETTDESRLDAAGGGTVSRTDGAELRTFADRHLDLDRPADAFGDIGLLIFASKHAGETGKLLTAHHTGNFGPADHGGEPNTLARAAPNAHARVMDALQTYAPDGYEVGMECTHHGPTDVGAPSLFVEVGSGHAEWSDPDAARAVAQAILDLRDVSADRLTGAGADRRRHLVGFGGGHYAPRFERVTRDTEWAVGHVAADWGLEAVGDLTTQSGRDVIRGAFEQSRAEIALVAGERPELEDVIDDLGYRAVGETWVRETDGVDLDLVADVEERLGTVADGVRFGARAGEAATAFEVTALSRDLVDTASGIDQARTRAAIAERTLAFDTTDGGSRATGRLAVPADADIDGLVDELAAVLRDRFDEVTREGDELVARETVFDPERAATLGVPEGPKFGRLSAGETVEVDGREIPPAAVSEERERRFNCQ